MLFTDDQKMMIRITARFLSRSGFRFEEGNFYDTVYEVLSQMTPMGKQEMRELIEWVVSYELELKAGGAPAHAKKTKTR